MEQGHKVVQGPSLGRLVAFEQVSWPLKHRAGAEELAKRLEVFPQGIFILSVGREDVSQVTVSPKDVPPPAGIHGFEQMRDLPVSLESKTLWVTNLATKIGKRGGGFLTGLLGYVFAWGKQEGYSEIVTGITCYGLKAALEGGKASSPADYMAKGMNPALRALEKAAQAKGITVTHSDLIPHYWEEDEDSMGYGVLIRVSL